MATLHTSWAVAQEAGEAHSSIRVTNLQTSLPVAKDAWGRQGKLQPVLISASVSLREPFSTASSSDTVTNSTIHYGILSKAILESCQRCTEIFNSSRSANEGFTVEFLAQFIHLFLTQSVVQGDLDADYLRIVNNLVVPPKLLNSLQLVIKLPKASLIGNSISFRYHLTYKIDGRGPDKFSSVLRLHYLRIPTLVGVNPNERWAKQILVVNVELDPWIKEESYNELEEIVVKVLPPPRHFLCLPANILLTIEQTVEESSFQTLEALLSHLSRTILTYFIIPRFSQLPNTPLYPKIKISIEKPTAVTFADAPVVEILVDSDPQKDPDAKALWLTFYEKKIRPPFPLTGRLDEWIATQK